jgi:hypothetical protein
MKFKLKNLYEQTFELEPTCGKFIYVIEHCGSIRAAFFSINDAYDYVEKHANDLKLTVHNKKEVNNFCF